MKHTILAALFMTISHASFAEYKATCETSSLSCVVNGKMILGEECKCNSSKGEVVGKVVSTTGGPDISAGYFKSAALVGNYLCGQKLSEFNFEREFGTMFSNTYLNKNINKQIKSISNDLKAEYEKRCKTSKTLSDMSPQVCYDACYKTFKKDDAIKEQCYGTCVALEHKANTLVDDVAALIDSGKLNADSCDKPIKVNESGRNKVKKAYDEAPSQNESSNRNK